ncbi:MAG TPA: hypothetical protein P5531_06190 [Bacteroidales bacterium]|nr:hypothetical protein [Bacteroidales bacterium]HSA43772.1 hypothetical protein [Bacteroidales bacterium]
MKIFTKHFFLPPLLLMLLSGCATYYQKTLRYQEYVREAQFDKAKEWLEKDRKGKRPRNLLLHELNLGWVNWITGLSDSSNRALNRADLMIEDQQKHYGLEALALVSNPGVRPYQPEDFEKVMVNYFKAVNYIRLGKYEEALVECRRINLRLNELNDKYKDRKNRYSSDAFAHLLMGLVYEITGDHNNAFIAYRNALEAYEKVYEGNFGLGPPLQLKKDLLRSASRCGFTDEVRYYEEKFGFRHETGRAAERELIFLWHNGFGPVKAEWSLNFSSLEKGDGVFTLADEEAGISIPYQTAALSEREQAALSDVHFLRIAFPKYVDRMPVYTDATLLAGESAYPLEMAQNIREIAFKTLQDRMFREMGTALLRLAVKQSIEATLKNSKKEDMQGLGAAVSIVNALTEKADTRNWQTLPYAISYARIPLDLTADTVRLKVRNASREQEQVFSFPDDGRKSLFFVFSTLDSN